MNRRNFLKCAIGGTAIVVAAHSTGWSLETAKRWLLALFRKPDAIRISDTTLASLAAGYRKTTTKLYAAYMARTQEYDWIEKIEGVLKASGGREVTIPLDLARA